MGKTLQLLIKLEQEELRMFHHHEVRQHTTHAHSVIIDFTASTCASTSGPASISVTDGDPDVFLTASYLREVLIIKTTPVYLCVCVCVIYLILYLSSLHKHLSHMYSTGAIILLLLLPGVHHKCECDCILDPTVNSLRCNICNIQELGE